MSKRAEEFSIKYADELLAIIYKEPSESNYSRSTKMNIHSFDGSDIEQAAMDGYEQAEKDIIKHIREQVNRWMPDNPEGDEHLYGERVAFRSVLNLLKEMEEDNG